MVTASADSACPGDVATQKEIFSWIVGAGIGDQQVGNAWTAADKLASLPMNGDLNIFDKRGGTDRPKQIIRVCLHPQTTHPHCSHTAPLRLHNSAPDLPQGPTKSVTASTLVPSASTFYVGSYNGRIISGSIDAGMENLNGDGYTNLVSGLTGADGGRAWSGVMMTRSENHGERICVGSPPSCGYKVLFRF